MKTLQKNKKIWEYQGKSVMISLLSQKRKTIRFSQTKEGWECAYPSLLSLSEVERWLQNHQKSIHRFMQRSLLSQRKSYLPSEEASTIYLWGESYSFQRFKGKRKVEIIGKQLHLFSNQEDFSDFYRWANQQLQEFYEEISPSYLISLREKGYPYVPTFHFRKMKSRWGSCLPKQNRICLNSLLIHFPKEYFCYVLWHEYAHFLEANHSPRFWKIVAEKHPDYREIKKSLR